MHRIAKIANPVHLVSRDLNVKFSRKEISCPQVELGCTVVNLMGYSREWFARMNGHDVSSGRREFHSSGVSKNTVDVDLIATLPDMRYLLSASVQVRCPGHPAARYIRDLKKEDFHDPSMYRDGCSRTRNGRGRST